MTAPEQPTPVHPDQQNRYAFYEAFRAWFMQSGCDFWDECGAPEALATIAVEIAAQHAAEAVAALRCAACDGHYPNPDCPHLRNARDMGERIPCVPALPATPPPGDAGKRPQLNHGETTMMATGRYPYRKGFHWKDNWYFTRLPHGVVAIAKFTSPEAEDPEFEIKIPAEQWASIISSVSDFDETSVRYQQALDFHGAHD